MADSRVIQMIVKAAKQTGADPVALLATAITENGARYGLTPGDNGTSYSAFQWHKGGALGNHAPAWTLTQDAFNERAGQFAKYGVHHGKGAAAVQRPADPAGYEKRVNANESQARQLLKLPSGGVAQTVVDPKTSQQAPKALSAGGGGVGSAGGGLTVQGLLDSAKQHVGVATPETGSHALLTQLANPIQPVQPLALPSGAPAKSAPPNPTMMDKSNSTIVTAASKFLGTPYLWGGTTAKGLDCSGLVQLAVKNATGVTIPRVASAQYAASTKVAPKDMQPGDIIAFGTVKNVHHIGIYMGNGKMIEAPHTGAKVRVSSLAGRDDIVGAGRFPSTS